ncbi:sine oculis-binding protein homolog B isoform X2 [Salminus brasiliensis]
MNELLGWYGYDKVDLQDAEAADVRSFSNRTRRHHVSVLKENSDPKPSVVESKVPSCSSASAKNGVRESACFPRSPSSSSSSPHTKDLHSTHVVVPLIKPSTVEEQQNIQIVCVWCQKEGLKRYSLIMGSELKSFCSEKCFAMCRRAYFKRNKARDEDRHSDQSPPSPGQTVETPPQLMLKMNSNTRVCDWCKHVRHTKYLDFGAGEERLQFCSTKCLNQYKMDIFYREARAALTTGAESSPSHPDKESHPASGATGESQTLLTPESWDNPALEGDSKAVSPKEAPTPVSSSEATVLSSSSASSLVRAPIPAQHQKEQEKLSSSQLHSGRAAPRLAVDQPRVLQNPTPFLRLPLHAQGLHSPVHQPLRNPASSPTQRPLHPSPQLQTPSIHPLPPTHLLHPYTGPVLPFAPTYPHPIPPLVPSLGFPCPQPTLLVPYPIIVPLPVPVPIPIPIPIKSSVSSHTSVIQNPEGKGESGTETMLVVSGDLVEEKVSENSEIITHSLVEHRVKTEQPPSPPDFCTSPFSSLTSQSLSAHLELNTTPPLPVVKVAEHRDDGRERQVIQRVVHRHPVKQEPDAPVVLEQREAEQGPGWSTPEDEDDSTAQQSPNHNTGASEVPLINTHSSAHSTCTSSPTHTLTTSLVLRKALNPCSINAPSVVTATGSVVLSNSIATPVLLPSVYSSNHLPTIQATPVTLDRLDAPSEHRTNSTQILAPSPDPERKLCEREDVKENFSESHDPSINHSCSGEQTDCQTDQSEDSRTGPTDGDTPMADEEHTYARSIPPKLREKNAHTITQTAAHTLSYTIMHTWDKSSHSVEQSNVHLNAEPALKRRCLRIRDQNK